jgi:hypothetical protein
VEYMYRDGSNYKTWGHEVLAGTLDEEVRQRLVGDGERMFLPGDVGLPTLQEDWDSHYEDDHIWHELTELRDTDQPPTVELMTAAEFAARMESDEAWDEAAATERLQQWVESTPEGH